MLEAIDRSAPVGIGVVADRVLLRVNQRICEMTGYAAVELLNRSARVLRLTGGHWGLCSPDGPPR